MQERAAIAYSAAVPVALPAEKVFCTSVRGTDTNVLVDRRSGGVTVRVPSGARSVSIRVAPGLGQIPPYRVCKAVFLKIFRKFLFLKILPDKDCHKFNHQAPPGTPTFVHPSGFQGSVAERISWVSWVSATRWRDACCWLRPGNAPVVRLPGR